MLATYSDEKLKSIQLSLQEKQKIRDISREEVEKSLRQSGLASMANALKDNLEKGIAWNNDILCCMLHVACSDGDFKWCVIYTQVKENAYVCTLLSLEVCMQPRYHAIILLDTILSWGMTGQLIARVVYYRK